MEEVGDVVASSSVIEKETNLYDSIHGWCQRLQKATNLVAKKASSKEPYATGPLLPDNVWDWMGLGCSVVETKSLSKICGKFIYQALQDSKTLRKVIQDSFKLQNLSEERSFWIKFALIHCYSCIAKWNEACDQLTDADEEHRLCIRLIEQVLEAEDAILPKATKIEKLTELQYGFIRIRYLLIYELTRYAILSSERDNQEKALELLTKAEEFYHTKGGQDTIQITCTDWPMLSTLDNLNSEKSSDMFVYVLFYLGQAYMISDNKEKAIFYLHMVLRKQLEKKSSSSIVWSADTVKMATAVLTNVQSFQACRTLLLAATTVLDRASEDEKSTDEFKQTWADLGRVWMKLGLEILDASADRLKDLEEQTRKPLKFSDTLKFTHFEKLSLELNMEAEEFDTLLLVNSLTFPTLDLTEVQKDEMPARYARDFEEARAIFLPLQRWFRICKEYYVIDVYASDYIELVTDYSTSFKYLVFFEPNIERQIKMQNRRLQILEELLKALNPVAYNDVFHYVLKDLADIYESVYKLKVSRARERGEPLRPKDKKLVKLLSEAVGAHRRNLDNFQFDLNNSIKDFPEAYEKALLGTVLSIGRIMGSISHDHPLHPESIRFAQDGKAYYQYFLAYLNRHPQLKADFKVLYDGAVDLPQLLDAQIDRIKQRLEALNIG